MSLLKKSVHARVRKPFQKKWNIFGTGSRRGATPGRLGAQNRWFLTGFRPEGRLHRTRGRDRPGALGPRRAAAQLMMRMVTPFPTTANGNGYCLILASLQTDICMHIHMYMLS